MSDDKRPDWKKGFDRMRYMYKDFSISSTSTEFINRASSGKELLFNNSKETIEEIKKILPRMKVNHHATVIGVKSYLNHRFYVYQTLKKRLVLYAGLGGWLFLKTNQLKYAQIHRAIGLYVMFNILIPDLMVHKRRLSLEISEHTRWLANLFK
ncbi:unnamed protein product [Moneuplotes crassus]|uniref:Uncharacterized protein n=1 Tax=Euplotes crassus TaxID=5936 RepID=A0AAD1Y2H0_EUPCR|nr:unnamed protein product [Moneuplotes crassus]